MDGAEAPSRNDEYLLYQTLVGTWPRRSPDEAGLAPFRERIEAYMLKAAREGKEHTSWINPNDEYEKALAEFVRGLLRSPAGHAFPRAAARLRAGSRASGAEQPRRSSPSS